MDAVDPLGQAPDLQQPLGGATMPFMALPGLSFGPKICKQTNRLVVRSGWHVTLLSLGMLHREVVVDPRAETFTVTNRYLWAIKRTRVIPFGDVRRILYRYDDMNPFTSLGATGNSSDSYSVALKLRDASEVALFSFVGDGAYQNNSGLPDWCYWSEFAFDWVGDQANESKRFVELLSSFTGAPLV